MAKSIDIQLDLSALMRQHAPDVAELVFTAQALKKLISHCCDANGLEAATMLDTLKLMVEATCIDRDIPFEEWRRAAEDAAQAFGEWGSIVRH